MAPLKASIAALSLILFGLLIEAQNPVLTFTCSDMPDVCTNMCWGAFCTRNPEFGTNLHYDKADDKTKTGRRRSAGCVTSGPNRCSALAHHTAGFNCDEYPFASTSNADLGSAVSRCVPSAQNNLRGNSQGGVLGRFFRQGGGLGCGGAACDFSVAFNTAGVPPGGADFCHNEPCVNPTDEPIFQAGGPALAPPPGRLRRSASPSPAYFYKTASGLELSSPNDLAIGSRTIEIKPRNLTLLLERSNEIVADESSLEERGLLDDDDMYETVHDTIVARLEAPAKRSPVNEAPEPRTVPEFQNVATQPFEPRDNPDCSIFQCLKDIGSTIKDATDCFQPDNPKADIECALGVPIKTIEAIATCTKCKVISGGCPNGGNSTQSGAPANPFDRNCGVNGDRPVLDGPGKCSEADGQVGAKAGDKVLGGRLWHCSNTATDVLNRCDFNCGLCSACQ